MEKKRKKMLVMNSKLDSVMKLTHPCRCRLCENSCNFGSGALADGELEKIAGFLKIENEDAKKRYFEEIEKFNTKRHRPMLLREGENPYGMCVFYEKDKGCKIHTVKPLECKIAMGCKDYGEELIIWFDLNYFLNPKDPESIRQYKVYLEAGGKTLPGASIKEIADEKTIRTAENYEDIIGKKDWEEALGIKGMRK